MDEPLLVALPDDALLAVLAYLLPRQLLKCRQVNRRFSNLCLHPDLWRRVRLDVRAVDDLIVWRAALRLAPCLRELDLGPHVYLEDAVTALYRTTCVIAKLGLVLVFDQDVARAAAVVRRQSSLGGLGALRLRFVQRVPNINPLFVAVCCLNNPYDLQIENTSHVPLLAPVCELAGSPSLKKLYYISSTKDTLLEALLKRHATTLEQLHLDIRHPLVPVSSLKALPKLRSLRLAHNIDEDLSELKALPSLNFTLDVNYNDLALL